MRKLLKVLITLSILFNALLVSTGFAAEYADTLRVGIYYDAATVKSLTLSSDSGFSVGVVLNRMLESVAFSDSSTLTVEMDKTEGVPTCYVSYSTCVTAEEAVIKAEEFKSSGTEVFIGYIDSVYHVLGESVEAKTETSDTTENTSPQGMPIEVSSKSLMVKDDKGKIVFILDDLTNGLGIYRKDYTENEGIITISGSAKGTYRGGFECKSLDGESMTVVNVIPVEDYLYSVVCREMSPSWEVEALKAQAVCARNFALGRINYHKKYGFDVCRTVCCQAYATTADNSPSVHTAVDETRGELLFYDDTLVQAVYSSSMGARTEDVKNVWGSTYPYLVSVENPYEDTENIYNGKWTKTLTKTRATEIMKARGYDVGNVTDITVLERTKAGGVLKLKVSGTNGSKTFERESCRTIFSEATYSQRYTVTTGGMTVYPTINVASGKTQKSVSLEKAVVLGRDGKTTNIDQKATAYDGKTKKEYNAKTTEGNKDTFTFSGEGWGHGVGLSQYGAKGMAVAGFTYDEILTHYYTGTYLEKAY